MGVRLMWQGLKLRSTCNFLMNFWRSSLAKNSWSSLAILYLPPLSITSFLLDKDEANLSFDWNSRLYIPAGAGIWKPSMVPHFQWTWLFFRSLMTQLRQSANETHLAVLVQWFQFYDSWRVDSVQQLLRVGPWSWGMLDCYRPSAPRSAGAAATCASCPCLGAAAESDARIIAGSGKTLGFWATILWLPKLKRAKTVVRSSIQAQKSKPQLFLGSASISAILIESSETYTLWICSNRMRFYRFFSILYLDVYRNVM